MQCEGGDQLVTPGHEKQTREISPTSCPAKLVSSSCDLLGITGTIWLLLACTVLDALPAKETSVSQGLGPILGPKSVPQGMKEFMRALKKN